MTPRLSVKNTLGPLPVPLTNEEILEQYAIVRNMNGLYSPENVYAAKERLTCHFFRLVLATAGTFGRRNPELLADFVSEATWKLWLAVNRIEEGVLDAHHPEPNIDAYIAACINGGMKYLRTSAFRRQRRFVNVPFPERFERASNLIEVKELIEIITQTPQEKNFIKLILEGYKGEELAEILEVSEGRLAHIRKTLRERLRAKL